MANNAFGIILNTQLDTKKADQQLKAFTKSREIITTIKIKDPETKQVETAIKKVSTLVDEVSNKSAKKVEIFDLDGNKISSEVKSVTDSFKNLVTATNDYKAGIRDVSTETEKSKEAMNGFEKLADSSMFSPVVAPYICQIYFHTIYILMGISTNGMFQMLKICHICFIIVLN